MIIGKKKIGCVVAALMMSVVCGLMEGGGVRAQSWSAATGAMTFGVMNSAATMGEMMFDKDAFEYGQIIFYNPCDGGSGSGNSSGGGSVATAAGGCAKLAELRSAMWSAASDRDKNRFINVVHNENAGLAAVEAFMNRALIFGDGDLGKWLDRDGWQGCRGFMYDSSICNNPGSFSDKDDAWVLKALGGSNVTNFATGNSSWSRRLGSAGTGGPLTCLWIQNGNEDGGECKSDVDYSKSPYKDGGQCQTMIEAAGGNIDSGWECWSWDGTKDWSSSMASQCAGSSSVGATAVATGASTSSATWENGWLVEDSIPGMKKEDVTGKSDLSEGVKTKYTTSDGKPNKILLHATEGTTNGYDAYPSGNKFPAHFTIDLKKKEGYQHFSINQPSLAIKKHDEAGPIQIEIVGFDSTSNPGYKEEYDLSKFSSEDWQYLVKLLKAISAETGIPLKSSVDWTKESRLSEGDFKKYEGVLGHMHAPDNDHDDPGDIWKYIEAVLGTTGCELSGDTNSISGAKNAEKQASEVGEMTFKDNDTGSMKTLLENYGDLAYRTGQAYGVPWIAILMQGRYEDSKAVCGSNNFWGIACTNGSKAGEGSNLTNLGKGFEAYGKAVQKDRYKDAVKEKDAYEYLVKLGKAGWRASDAGVPGYEKSWLDGVKNSINALTKYIESEEGKQVIAQFGAASCTDGYDDNVCNVSEMENLSVASGATALQELVKEWAWDTHGPGKSSAKPAYKEAMKKASYTGACNGQDCGAFVSNLIIQSGWDPDYPAGSTQYQAEALKKSSSWADVTSQVKSNSDAQPGDVIICNNGVSGYHCKGSGHHVLIYVGDVGFNSPMASASQCGRWPEADAYDDIKHYIDYGYHIYRKK